MLNTVHSKHVTHRLIMAMRHLIDHRIVPNMIEFAESIGSTQPNVSAMAAGRRFATVDNLVAACDAYSINPTWLLLGTGRMFRPVRQEKEPVSAP